MRVVSIVSVLWVVSLVVSYAVAEQRCVEVFGSGGRGLPIVIDPNAGSSEVEAAGELADILRRMTGDDFAVVREASGQAIRVSLASRLAEFRAGEPGPDGLSIEVGEKGVVLAGGDDRGVGYAVTTFLEDLGVRWCMPGEFGRVIPRRSEIRLPFGRRVEKPDFAFRQIWYAYGAQSAEGEKRLLEWRRHNKVGHLPILHGHNLTTSLPKGITFANHPEYFAVVGGRRSNTQLCTSDPEVIRLVEQRVCEFFDQNPGVASYSLCPDDNTRFCECSRCRALDVGGADPYTGKPLITDRYMIFLNAIARGVQSRHPGKKVTTYAYDNYSIPPQKVAIDPHVVIVFTTSNFCSIHSVADDHCESRQRMRTLLSEWTKRCGEVYIYEYDPIPFNAELPCPLYGQRMRDMPVYKAMGIRGFTFESHQSWATLSPNYYVSAKLMWNSRLDGRAVLRDWCEAFFGPAGPAMFDYYMTQERAFSEYHQYLRWSLRDIPRAFGPVLMEAIGGHLKAAEEVAREAPYRQRVAMVRMAYDYLSHYIAARSPAGAGQYEVFRSHLNGARGLIERMRGEGEDFILAKVAREYLDKSLDAQAVEMFSKDMGLISDWWVIGPFDNTGGRGHDRVYPPELRIDMAGSCPGKEGPVRWQRHTLPSWRGYVDLMRVMKPTDWVCAYATVAVVSPVRRAVQFRVGSNDSVAVFLNGKKVLDRKVERLAKIDDDIVPVELQPGRNVVLLKIGQTGGEWGFFFRITDDRGGAIRDLEVGPDK